MYIRRAEKKDIQGINRLLFQVLTIHHEARPDLFKANVKKYTDQQLAALLLDDTRPVFLIVDPEENVLGYAFCVFQETAGHNILADRKTLYIDDLCVAEGCRGQHIGTQLCQYVQDYARRNGCHSVTLNVWACNEDAVKFYEKYGFQPQKMGMELLL